MLNPENKKNGQAIVGGVLVIVLLVALVIFVFSLIRRPNGQPSPELASSGLSDEALSQAAEDIQTIEQKFPVAQVLPYGGPVYGAPFAIHKPRTDGTILVEIDSTVDFEAAKEVALQWIRDQGYNPDEYNFTFKSSSFSD